MVLPKDRGDREHRKFCDTDDGPAVRICGAADAEPVPVSGTQTPTGLSDSMTNTTLAIGTTALALPATGVVGRNSIWVTNNSLTQRLYIGDAAVTADNVVGTTSGFPLSPQATQEFTITDGVTLYGRYPAAEANPVLVSEFK